MGRAARGDRWPREALLVHWPPRAGAALLTGWAAAKSKQLRAETRTCLSPVSWRGVAPSLAWLGPVVWEIRNKLPAQMGGCRGRQPVPRPECGNRRGYRRAGVSEGLGSVLQ